MGIDDQMKEYVTNIINNSVAATYAYHNIHHTMYVYEKAIEIAMHEKCNAAEMRLIKAAALWHDTGYIHVYYNHEEESCVLAKKNLHNFGFTLQEIDIICEMIMATKIPQKAGSKLAEILADADLEYLGTNETAVQADELYQELKALNPQFTLAAWNRIQIDFLEQHRFFTAYCQREREPKKQQFLQQLKRNN